MASELSILAAVIDAGNVPLKLAGILDHNWSAFYADKAAAERFWDNGAIVLGIVCVTFVLVIVVMAVSQSMRNKIRDGENSKTDYDN